MMGHVAAGALMSPFLACVCFCCTLSRLSLSLSPWLFEISGDAETRACDRYKESRVDSTLSFRIADSGSA